MDSCSVESQSLIIMNMTTDEICDMFLFTKKTVWTKILTKEAIRKMKGNMALAAELLKMDPDTLAEKVKKNPPPAPTWQSVQP